MEIETEFSEIVDTMPYDTTEFFDSVYTSPYDETEVFESVYTTPYDETEYFESVYTTPYDGDLFFDSDMISETLATIDAEYQEIVLERLDSINDSCQQTAIISTLALTIAVGAVIIYVSIRPILDFLRR